MAITIQDAEFDEAQQILELQKIVYQQIGRASCRERV